VKYLICRKWRGGTHVETLRIFGSKKALKGFVRSIDLSVSGNDYTYWFAYRVYPDREPEPLKLKEMKEIGLR